MSDGTDVLFSRELRADLGQWSARTGMIQALRQIGGPEAIAAMSQILENRKPTKNWPCWLKASKRPIPVSIETKPSP